MNPVAIALLGGFFVGLVLGVPLYLSLGLSSILIIVFFQVEPIAVVASTVSSSMNSFSLIAVPLFILAGNILADSQVGMRLIDLARVLVGKVRGGLLYVSVGVGLFFAGVSGSGPADTAALGAPLIPAMERAGYSRGFAGALIAACGCIGIIFPPSLGFIMYGIIAKVSIGKLFVAGVFPGVLMAASLAIVCFIQVRRRGWDLPAVHKGTGDKVDVGLRATYLGDSLRAFRHAFWGLLAPVILLAGLYGGILTPTEVATAVVIYALMVALFIYRDLSLKNLAGIIIRSAHTTGIVMILVASASVFSFLMNTQGVAAAFGQFLVESGNHPYVFLLIINVILLIAGCLVDGISITYVFTPIFLPVAIKLGIDPAHFGVIMVVNIAIGQVTPPVGVNLFTACAVGKIKLADVAWEMPAIILGQVICLAVVTLFPAISLWLPAVFGF